MLMSTGDFFADWTERTVVAPARGVDENLTREPSWRVCMFFVCLFSIVQGLRDKKGHFCTAIITFSRLLYLYEAFETVCSRRGQ